MTRHMTAQQAPMDPTVRHNPEQSRYEISLDGEVVGIADYYPSGDALVFPHTEINAELRGRGLGEQLVRGALDDVRTAGRKIVPRCWFVAEFVEINPEYQDLVSS